MKPLPEPVIALRQYAEAALEPGMELSIHTDADSYKNAKPPTVLIAIARPGHSFVMAVAASEYDGLALARMAGWAMQAPTSAHEKAVNNA